MTVVLYLLKLILLVASSVALVAGLTYPIILLSVPIPEADVMFSEGGMFDLQVMLGEGGAFDVSLMLDRFLGERQWMVEQLKQNGATDNTIEGIKAFLAHQIPEFLDKEISPEKLQAHLEATLPDNKPEPYSIIRSVETLYNDKSYLIAGIVLTFSVIVPILKQTIMTLGLLFPKGLPKIAIRILEIVHRWAMVDVFVLAIALVAVTRSSFVEGETGNGLIYFLIYILTSGLLMFLLQRQTVKA